MFFPYRDDNPTDITPYVTIGLIVVNILAFILQIAASDWGIKFAMIPSDVVNIESPASYPNPLITLFTSMFMHGGPFHLIGNMFFLWIFGNNVEDTFGHYKFIIFYLFCGLVADMAHIALNYTSLTPTLGASGAISGVMGAYMLLYPHARIHIAYFYFGPLHKKFDISALYYLGFWIIMQLFYTYLGLGGVAWYAHIGGFAAGALIIFLHVLIAPVKNHIDTTPIRKKVYFSKKRNNWPEL